MDDGTDVSADDNIDNSRSRSLVEHRGEPGMLGVTEALRLARGEA